MKIGIYGGSFDPVHKGHVQVGRELLKRKNFDEIWYIPAKVNPHKTTEVPVLISHRIAMLDLALEKEAALVVKNLEGRRDGPSYTIDTLKEIVSNSNDDDFVFIMGDDVVENFLKWKSPEEIVQLVSVIIVSRVGNTNLLESVSSSPAIYDALLDGWTEMPVIDVSSTELRRKLEMRNDCSKLVPEKVLDYIFENQLYYTN